MKEYSKKVDALNNMMVRALEIPAKYNSLLQIKEKAIALYKVVES